MSDLQARLEEAERRVMDLVDAQAWYEALREARALMDSLHEEADELGLILRMLELDAEALEREGSASSLALLGMMYYNGMGGVREDTALAWTFFEKAASEGHVYSVRVKGFMLLQGDGPEGSEGGVSSAALSCFVDAAERGCRIALADAGGGFEFALRRYHAAATYYLRFAALGGSSEPLSRLLGERPLQCSPLGVWTPSGGQALVAIAIHNAQVCWMKVAKRLKVTQYAALLVAAYICTEGTWSF